MALQLPQVPRHTLDQQWATALEAFLRWGVYLA
jgi:hypothetical protein